jgi:hypothetical protein
LFFVFSHLLGTPQNTKTLQMSDDAPSLQGDSKVQDKNNIFFSSIRGARGGAVVEALRYKPEGRAIESQWCYWNFSLT